MGRPTKLTPATHAKIVQLMRDGNYFSTACQVAGIEVTTGHKWMAWGEGRDYGRNAELPKDLVPFQKFREAVIEAEGEAIAESVKHLRQAGDDDWRAAAEYLKRRRPEDWNRGQVEVKHSGEVKVSHEMQKVLEDYAAAFDDEDDEAVDDDE